MNTDLKRNAGRLALTEKILQRRWGGPTADLGILQGVSVLADSASAV